MINLRYHIVSLIAVFFALALGVIAGTTVIDQGLVKTLRSQGNHYRTANDGLEAVIAGKNGQLSVWNTFGKTLFPSLEAGQLKGWSVLDVVEPGTDPSLVSGIDGSVVQAGGVSAGRLTFTSLWAIPNTQAAEQLAVALGVSPTDNPTLMGAAATKLAGRLRAPADPTGHDDLVESLVRNGFVTLSGAGTGAFPPAHTLLAYISSGVTPSVPDHVTFAIPFLRALEGQIPAAVAEPLGSAESLAERVRADGALNSDVATIDHADTAVGQYALIYSLHAIAAGVPAPAFGTRHGVAVAPGRSPQPTPTKSAATPTPKRK